jgi:hypothetical protein
MRRRDFIRATAGLVSIFAGGSVLGASQRQLVRAAVVVGVDKPVGLPRLNAAVTGAKQFAAWLASESFEVKSFTDDQGPVEAHNVVKAVADLVQRGTLDQLLIYFSGHGFLNNYTEYWLLSAAPSNVNEAICLTESCFLARMSGIPNVIFVSDACRSTPTSLGTSLVRGSPIFPINELTSNVDTDIDQFLATHPGNPAFEVPIDQSVPAFQGIFTAAFLSAFTNPISNIVQTVDGVSFIPNRRLKPYLQVEVAKRAQAKSIQLRQRPDAIIESDNNTYIGKVATTVARPQEPAAPTLGDVARAELHRAGADIFESTAVMNASELTVVADRTGFNSTKDLISRTQGSLRPESRTGLSVTGAILAATFSDSATRIEVVEHGNGLDREGYARVDLRDRPAGSVALQFADGSGTVLVALRDFIATVLVNDGRVISVSYIPSRDGDRWAAYQSERDRLDELRATVATSAVFGQFRIDGVTNKRKESAEQLADRIRVLKGLDPTLGLYAAYAYAQAGLIDKVRSVRSFMRSDLGTDFFDLALLSTSASERPAVHDPQSPPHCPVLSQGWNLLRAKGVNLQRDYERARDHLRDALWTTFDEAGMSIVRNSVQANIP